MTSHKFGLFLTPFSLCHTKMSILFTSLYLLSQLYLTPLPDLCNVIYKYYLMCPAIGFFTILLKGRLEELVGWRVMNAALSYLLGPTKRKKQKEWRCASRSGWGDLNLGSPEWQPSVLTTTLSNIHILPKHGSTLVCYLFCTGRTRVQIPARERTINSE